MSKKKFNGVRLVSVVLIETLYWTQKQEEIVQAKAL